VHREEVYQEILLSNREAADQVETSTGLEAAVIAVPTGGSALAAARKPH
jgi:hypothetical protein